MTVLLRMPREDAARYVGNAHRASRLVEREANSMRLALKSIEFMYVLFTINGCTLRTKGTLIPKTVFPFIRQIC